jgi:hypothetical protein
MFEIIKDPKIQHLSKSLCSALIENNELLKDIIIHYEKRCWTKLNAHERIDSYLKELMEFRRSHMYSETKHIFQSILHRMK